MPRIDPAQLLKTLTVLLDHNGGIKSAEEVSRLVQLMQKFSKKLVSKVTYVKILKASKSELLDKFLNEKGWDLLNYWFSDAIRTNNWPLCAELTELFNQCPMTAHRLKENVEKNQAPKLIKQLNCDVRVDLHVRQLAKQVLDKWMAVVMPPAEGPSGSLRTTRGMRNVIISSNLAENAINSQKVHVMAYTSTEDIVNLPNMTVSSGSQAAASDITVTTDTVTNSGGHAWKGKGGAFKSPLRGAGGSRSIMAARQKGAPPPGRSKEIIESEDESDDDYKPPSDPFDAILNSGKVKSIKVKPTGLANGFGVIKNECLDAVDDLIDGNSDDEKNKPVQLLAGMANELSKSLKKEVVDEIKKEDKDGKSLAEKLKEKEKRREKERQREKERDKDKDRHKDKYKDKHRDKDRDREKDRRKDEDRRRREKERERQKEKERKEKKRESKPYRETEMRDGLDSSEKQRIKELAQKMREESSNKKEEIKPASSTAGLARIPKIPKKEEINKEVKDPPSKKGTTFEDLMFAMDSSTKSVKAPPIKNKNKDLLESISNSMSSKPTPKSTFDGKLKTGSSKASDYLLQMRTEDKSKAIIRADSGSKLTKVEEKKHSQEKSLEVKKDDIKVEDKKLQDKKPESAKIPEKKEEEKKKEEIKKKDEENKKDEDKKASKRPASENDFKIKIKSPAQLKESSMFGDFLSTIMPDVPKKKKIKLSDLKAQKEAKAAAENIMKPEEGTESQNGEQEPAPFFSFYREVTDDDNGLKKSPERGNSSPESNPSKSPSQEIDESNKDVEMPFAEPERDLPREVRGILVYAKGPKRTRRIQWRSDDSLVETQYFELDETERVNVNKLKFEEQRKRELELEKTALHKKPSSNELNDARQWPTFTNLALSCELPEIDYGGNSNEKREQPLRENTVLQALFFNNKLPSDPLEPDAAGGARGETKPIPLEDFSGDSDLNDYSNLGWPEPVHDMYTVKETSPNPGLDLLNNIQPNILQNIIGGGGPIPETGNTVMDEALYNAQKAAEETLRKQGLLPSKLDNEDPDNIPMDQNMPPPFIGRNGPEMMDFENFPQGPPDFPNHPNDMGFYPPMEGNWRRGGAPRGGPPVQRNGHPGGDFNRGGQRGFPPMGPRGPMGPVPPRGFPPMNKHNGGFIDRNRDNFNNRNHHHNNHRRDDNRRDHGNGKKDFRRPCKFWIEQGFCREEGRCKFPHPTR